MSERIKVNSITMKNKTTDFNDKIMLEVVFTTYAPITRPLYWNVLYVGSAYSQQHDQDLMEFQIHPLPQPIKVSFTVECFPPVIEQIPFSQLLCLSALLLTATCRRQQFLRIGLFVQHKLKQQVGDMSQQNLNQISSKIQRTFMIQKPKITFFQIQWEKTSSEISTPPILNSSNRSYSSDDRKQNEDNVPDPKELE